MKAPERTVDEIVNTDVLVIGGGVAGCFAAIEAAKAGLTVTIVEKANVGRSGTSHQMSGVLTYFDPDHDDAGKWYQECTGAGEGLCDPHRLRGMVEETTDRIRDLEAWGVGFLKEKGEFVRKPGVGHQYARNVILTNGSYQLMSVLRGEVLRRGIRLVERVMVVDLLTSDGRSPTAGAVTGAVGFGVRSGKRYAFSSPATIIAAGCTRSVDISPATMSSLSGDGRGMAFRAGCEMRNIEFTHFSPGPAHFMCAPGINILFGEGAVMVNARGERFMQKWDAVRVERAPRAVLSKAMAVEEREGRGPIYLDARGLDEGAHRRIELALPIVINSFHKGGLDLRKDAIEYSLRLTDLGPGGVRADAGGATGIAGMYVAGASSDHGEDGVSNVIGHGMESCIGGARAGRAAAVFAADHGKTPPDPSQVSRITEEMFRPMTRQKGISHQEIRHRVKDLGREDLLGPVRNAAGINQAIAGVEELRSRLPHLAAGDYHELTRVLGLDNELLFLETLARCALYRTESRGSHCREDYPERDDAKWLRWVIARKDDGNIKIWDEPVKL